MQQKTARAENTSGADAQTHLILNYYFSVDVACDKPFHVVV